LNSLKNKEESEFTSLDSSKFSERDIEYFSLLSLNSLKNKEESEFTSLDSLKFSKKEKRMGKKLDLLHCCWQQSIFESPLNIHKMSQVICHHSWVLVWPWENLPRSLSVGPPPIGYSSSHMESLWMPPASQTYCVNAA
jgi:hypothetical protein